MEEQKKQKASVRARADAVREFRCKNLIAVIEDPTDIRNIGTDRKRNKRVPKTAA